jgi:hypothetical protein
VKGIFGQDPTFQRVSPRFNLGLSKGERLPRGEAELRMDQVDPCPHLGDRMLHLQAGVDLQEKIRTIRGEQKLNGPSPAERRLGC